MLGPVRLYAGDAELPTPGGPQGLLLQLLLVHLDQPVTTSVVVETIWADADPDVARRRLHLTASRLRRRLPAGARLEATSGGYRLAADGLTIDRLEFEALALRARSGDAHAAREAMRLWRGEPYLGFGPTEDLRRERGRLSAIRADLEAMTGSCTATSDPVTAVSARPSAVERLIPRPRLLDQLPRIGAVRLIALTAPRGYGKTALLREWADREAGQIAWTPLAAPHDDRATFHESLRSGLSVAAGLDSGAEHDRSQMTIVDLVNLLLRASAPIGIVLDDLQNVTNPQIHADVADLLRLCPEHVTVAIGSTQSLPFPTSRLAASQQMARLDLDDLAFTPDELGRLVDLAAGGPPIGPPGAWQDRLHSMTLGWPEPTAAIASAATGRPAAHLDEAVAAYLSGSDLADRILDDLPVDLSRFLIDTSHLEVLDPQLCGLVSDHPAPAGALDTLAARHHLISHDGAAHRHHRMVSLLLRAHRARRGRARSAQGHLRAARWYLDHDRADRALDHGAAAGDPDLVAAALAPAVRRAASCSNGDALGRWAASIELVAPIDPDSVHAAQLTAVFLPSRGRGRWNLDPSASPPGALPAASEAVDLVRAGRCQESLAAAAQARDLLGRPGRAGASDTTGTIETLLSVVETESLLLLGGPNGDDPDESLPRRADGSGWPALMLWSYGLQALRAWLSGNVGLAAALLDHARQRAGQLHPSWMLLTDGSACVTHAILEIQRAQASDSDADEGTIDRLRTVADRDELGGSGPIAVVARYALHMAHHGVGNGAAAGATLAEADAALAQHAGLGLLHVVRDRLVDDATAPTDELASLSPRQLTVLGHLDSDLTLAEIAEALHVSQHTVKAHTRSIYRKLGVSSRAQAVAIGLAAE